MLTVAAGVCAWRRFCVGDAIVVSDPWLDGIGMDVSNGNRTADTPERQRIVLRAAPLAVRVWTGRSALSAATTTHRPHFATAGTRHTRVSAMRLSAPYHAARRDLE
jgi:hypothetical protein